MQRKSNANMYCHYFVIWPHSQPFSMNGDEFESVASVFCRNIETPSCLWVWIWIYSTTTATEKERSIVVGAEGSRESRSFLQLKAELCCLLYILFQKDLPPFLNTSPFNSTQEETYQWPWNTITGCFPVIQATPDLLGSKFS